MSHFTSQHIAVSKSILGNLLPMAFRCLWILVVFAAPLSARQHKLNIQADKRLSQLSVDNWTTDDGLPSNTLLDLSQTPDGFLWMGSYDGLVRFDGVNFKTYGKRNTSIFHTNVAFKIAATKDSTLWVGTQGSGLLAYKNEQFQQYGNPDTFIQSMLVDEEAQTVWVGTRAQGCLRFRWDIQQWDTLQHPMLQSAIVLDMKKDSQGRIWIATVAKGLLSYKNGTWQHFPLPPHLGKTQARRIYFDHKGKLWIGTGNGLYLFENEQFIPQQSFKGLLIHHISQDASGFFWVGSLQGLMRWNPDTGYQEWLENKTRQRVTDVYHVFQDMEGSIWIASYRQGLFRVKDSNFNNYNYSSEGLFIHPITAISQYKDNSYLVGNSQGQLFEFRDNTLYPMQTHSKLPESKIYQIIRDSDKGLWLATFNGVLHINAEGHEHFYQTSPPLPYTPRTKSLCESSDGAIWLGTFNKGLLKMSKKGELLQAYNIENDNFPSNYIMSVHEQEDGRILAGTNDQGVVFLDPSTGSYQQHARKDGLSSNLVFNTYTDKNGYIWVVTNGGLSGIAPNQNITNYTYKEGLPYDNPFDFIEDAIGNVWMPTSRGIIKTSKSELKAYAKGNIDHINWEVFDKRDGINYEQCTGAAFAYRDSLHNIWFPSIGGLIQVNPHHIVYNSFKPPVYIDAMRVDEQEVDIRHSSAIELPPDSQHYTFEYTALSLWAPSKVSFKYKMEGYDRTWVDAGNSRKATYTNLPPGWHTFHVIACNNDGIWNKKGAKFRFYIRPHFYQSPWFYFLGTIALIFGFRAFYTWRILSVQEQNNLLEDKVKERTTEIESQRRQIIGQNAEIARQNKALEKSKNQLLHLNLMLKKSNSNLTEEVGQRTEQLNLAMDKLNASSKELDNFIHQAPHDFRGPIARMLGILQVAKMEAKGREIPHLDVLYEVAQSMDTMLNKLLKVHDIVEMPPLELQEVNVEEVYKKCLKKLSERFPISTYYLSFDCQGDAYLHTEPELLEIILENLIENALMYTQQLPSYHRQVHVRFNTKGKQPEIRVWDNGFGIEKRFYEDIFQAFFKASERSQGNGLGLYLVKKAAEKLEAKLSVDSLVGRYTAMTVTFPAP